MKYKIRLFKIIDPTIQSLLFLLITYCINSEEPYFVPYKPVFHILLLWQIVSTVVHFFFKKTTMLKKQRKIHLIVLLVYLVAYLIFNVLIDTKQLSDATPDGDFRYFVYTFSPVVVGLGICFWYAVLCFREIKRIIDKNQHLDF